MPAETHSHRAPLGPDEVRGFVVERIAELTGRAFDRALLEMGPAQINIPRDYFYGEIQCEIPKPIRVERGAGLDGHAVVGGVDFDRNQYNMIYQGRRQPGSSFKPFVYATALAQGTIHLDDQISNELVTFPAPPGGEPYTPKNSNGKYGGTMSVRQAFAWSVNVPAGSVLNAGPA